MGRGIKQRLNKIEKEITKQTNPLFEIRRDLKEIMAVKKVMDYQNQYNINSEYSKEFFNGTSKQESIEEGCNIIKSIIIDLAEKYKLQIEKKIFKYINTREARK